MEGDGAATAAPDAAGKQSTGRDLAGKGFASDVLAVRLAALCSASSGRHGSRWIPAPCNASSGRARTTTEAAGTGRSSRQHRGQRRYLLPSPPPLVSGLPRLVPCACIWSLVWWPPGCCRATCPFRIPVTIIRLCLPASPIIQDGLGTEVYQESYRFCFYTTSGFPDVDYWIILLGMKIKSSSNNAR
jgi:hypothetical protein